LSYDTSKTRGYLKSFGVSVSLFEEEMLKLIERANNEDPRRVLEEAVKLTENLNKKVLEIVEHVLNIETELMKRLVERAFAGGGALSKADLYE
jgi:nucleoside-triphosphatase THEP1